MRFVDLAGSERVASKRKGNVKSGKMDIWEGMLTNFTLLEFQK
jgi:hypothetical protein